MRQPRKVFHICECITALAISVFPFAATAQEEEKDKSFSGPQVGEGITPFKVIEVTGPAQGTEVQIIDPKRKGPTFVMFVHNINPRLGLMITLEWYVHKHKELESHYVFLTDDKAKTERKLKDWWSLLYFAGSPLSISVDGAEGPGRYGLNRNVDMTVLVAKDNKVVSNFVLTGQNDTDTREILAAVAEAISKPAPSIDHIRAELRADRQRRRRQQIADNPIYKLAPNPRLGELMVATVDERVIEPYVKQTIDRMVKWAGDDNKKRNQLVTYCEAVLKGGFRINRYAREPLKKLAGDE